MRVGISGHQLLPVPAIAFVKTGIEKVISRLEHGFVGVSSLAAGSDQIFAAIVLKLGGRLHAIIPCKDYGKTFNHADDREQFTKLLQSATTVKILDHPAPSEEAFLDAGRQVVNDSDLLIAVWDGQPAKGKGGTGDIVGYAHNRGVPVQIIWPSGLSR